MRHKLGLTVLMVLSLVILGWGTALIVCWSAEKKAKTPPATGSYAEIEARLAPLATKMGKPKSSDWLASHKEPGQTFAQYFNAEPVRKSTQLNTMYFLMVGEFSDDQQKVMDITREYLETVYTVPVKVRKKIPLSDIPEKAQRKHPSWGDQQILTGHISNEILLPDRPEDALAYLAFTSTDLYPGPNWNFVFGEANLRDRVGVWSIYRFGNPAKSREEFKSCLRHTLKTASHETGHILTIQHCTAYECNMNGSNNLEEAERQPMHFCPVCLRKLCWNLQVEPVAYLKKLQTFCQKHGLDDEAAWYDKAVKALEKKE